MTYAPLLDSIIGAGVLGLVLVEMGSLCTIWEEQAVTSSPMEVALHTLYTVYIDIYETMLGQQLLDSSNHIGKQKWGCAAESVLLLNSYSYTFTP